MCCDNYVNTCQRQLNLPTVAKRRARTKCQDTNLPAAPSPLFYQKFNVSDVGRYLDYRYQGDVYVVTPYANRPPTPSCWLIGDVPTLPLGFIWDAANRILSYRRSEPLELAIWTTDGVEKPYLRGFEWRSETLNTPEYLTY